MDCIRPADIKCIVFDFGFTLSSDLYFKVTPPGYPHWRDIIQKHVFEELGIVEPWMAGALTIVDIAGVVAQCIDMDIPSIVETMEKGCEHLNFNPAVWNFALAQKAVGRKTALVTANMDVFTKVVVPSHRLYDVFDVILNTFDYKELRKECLWPIAFDCLGNNIHYENSLLIEDGVTAPAKFRALGGYAYQYSTDELFLEWLHSMEWK
ncbi:MAG TPA: hypothetical protein VK897_08605 [Anaerolineales bacterium]|nr:hypothetical protein [Anaerolineales bacterium]